MKKIAYIAFILSLSLPALGQYVTITGNVQDPNGCPYINGTGVAVLVPTNTSYFYNQTNPARTPVVIAKLDGFGHFSIQLNETDLLTPTSPPAQWQFSFSSSPVVSPVNTGPISFTMSPMPLTTSQDISATIASQAAAFPGGCTGGQGPPTPFATNIGGTGTTTPCASAGSLFFYTGIIFSCDPDSTTNGIGSLFSLIGTFNTVNTVGSGAGTWTTTEGTGIANPSAGKDTLYVSSVSHSPTCLSSSGAQCPWVLPTLTNKVLVDGNQYPATAAGINQAIADAITFGSREVYLPCGTTSINATLKLTGGAALIGCGSGRNQTISSPTTLLQWTGSSGQDMIEVCGSYPCGGASTRSDGVLLRNMILDGAGTDRYDLIVAENDTTRLENIRVRNAGTAAFYAADATGLVVTNFDCGVNSPYCMVLDWGTGGFVGNGIAIENDSSNATAPVLLIQGLSNNIKITGLQIDNDPTTFVGFIQIAGLDANSSFAGAVAGGTGAPNIVSIDGASFTAAGGGIPSQGNHSDVLLTAASTANVPHNIILSNCYFNEASANAVEVAFGTGVEISNCNSLNHTTATVLASANASLVSMWLVSSTDTARRSGAGAGVVMDLTQSTVGSLQNLVAGFSGTSLNLLENTAPLTSSGNDICYGDSTAHSILCSLNNGSFFPIQYTTTAAKTTNDCVKFDANGNTVDAGAACGGGGSNVPNLTGNSSVNTVRVAGSDFTTTSAALVAITGLSWTLPGSTAANYVINCNLMYSDSTTSSSGVAFGVQDVTTAPTNASGQIMQNTNGSGFGSGVITGLTTTTATSFGSSQPSVTTVIRAQFFMSVEQPSGTASVFQIMGDIAGGATLTVKRGSFCTLSVATN